MLNSRQRAYLKGLASVREVIIYVGKNGITENVSDETNKALNTKELVKCSVQETAPVTSAEACQILAEMCNAEPVQAIGRKFVLYRPNKDIPAEKRIILPD